MKVHLGRKVESLNDRRNKIRRLEEQIKILKTSYVVMADEIMDEMEKLGLSDATGKSASVHLKNTDVANVKDWDKVYNYIHRHKAYHLMFRRIADAAFREELELRGKRGIPGIEIFTRRSAGLLNSK